MMKSIKSQIYIYVILDIFLLLFSVYKGFNWIANSQIAFASSFSIILLSYLAYIKNITKQIELIGDIIDSRDYIDEIDDPYELYEEKNNNKKNKIKISMKNLSKSKSATFSPIRLIGYALLVGGFFLLINCKIFSVIPYILGISIIPLGALLNAIYQRKFNID